MPTVSNTSDPSQTRVESIRVPIDCAVDVRLDPSGAWQETAATNISMSGMFLRTTETQPSGAALDVRFKLQNGQPAIEAKVEVLWNRVRDLGPEAPQGLGVRFVELDLESKYAISRLVDRYQQLGRMPFQLAANEDEPLLTTRGFWERRGALALAFLAGAAFGTAGSFWLIARTDPNLGAAGVVRASELASKSVEPMSPPASVGRAGDIDVSSGDDAVAEAAVLETEIEATVESWARAWAGKDVERYLAAYSSEFQPASGQSLDAWRARRRERLARPGTIEVTVSALEVQALGSDRVLARFDQAYSAPGYRDRVRKQLELLHRDQEWKIEREEILEALAIE